MLKGRDSWLESAQLIFLYCDRLWDGGHTSYGLHDSGKHRRQSPMQNSNIKLFQFAEAWRGFSVRPTSALGSSLHVMSTNFTKWFRLWFNDQYLGNMTQYGLSKVFSTPSEAFGLKSALHWLQVLCRATPVCNHDASFASSSPFRDSSP